MPTGAGASSRPVASSSTTDTAPQPAWFGPLPDEGGVGVAGEAIVHGRRGPAVVAGPAGAGGRGVGEAEPAKEAWVPVPPALAEGEGLKERVAEVIACAGATLGRTG